MGAGSLNSSSGTSSSSDIEIVAGETFWAYAGSGYVANSTTTVLQMLEEGIWELNIHFCTGAGITLTDALYVTGPVAGFTLRARDQTTTNRGMTSVTIKCAIMGGLVRVKASAEDAYCYLNITATRLGDIE